MIMDKHFFVLISPPLTFCSCLRSMVSLGILNNLPWNGGCFQVSSEKRTPLKSSQEFLGVLQESVEPQPRGVSKREQGKVPALGPQKQMNLETLRACQRSGEE